MHTCVLYMDVNVPCVMCAFVCVAGYDFVVSPQHANASTAWTNYMNTILAVINLAPKRCGVDLREH